jgi:hypothetical protein
MAFVNQFTSEEDIEKYGLDSLLKKFRPFAWREGRPSVFRHAWTIDRERNIYFLPVKSVESVGPSGRPEATTERMWVLGWQGKELQVSLDRAAGTWANLVQSPIRIVWKLTRLDMSEMPQLSREEVIAVLKEALTVYGEAGAHHQVPSTAVEFLF